MAIENDGPTTHLKELIDFGTGLPIVVTIQTNAAYGIEQDKQQRCVSVSNLKTNGIDIIVHNC
jgi:hypothetical protein